MEDFLFIYRPVRDTFPGDASEYESGRVTQHFEHLRRLQMEGRLMVAGRSLDLHPVGIAILRFVSIEDALAFSEADPAVEAGVFSVEVSPFRVALEHPFLLAQRESEAEIERKRVLGF